MKAISLHTPWDVAILRAGKDVENRSWRTNYRGPVLIHVSKWWDEMEIAGDITVCRGLAIAAERSFPTVTLRDLRARRGMIVGRARIIDCVTRSDSPWFFGLYGLVLAEPEAFPKPIPCTGARRLFEVDLGNVR